MKRIWITGASSGIGAALAESLLSQGHHLAVTARSLAPLQALASRWPEQVLVLAGDVTDPSQVRAMAQRLHEAWGRLDQLIINAGICEYLEVDEFDSAMVERVIRTNVFAAAYCVEHALPLLRQAKHPHLVAVSSSVTYLPLPRAEAYGASKAALRYLFESLRIDLAAEGIDVTLISPGFVDTPLTQQNDFPMPMRLSVEQAVAYICSRLEKRPLEIIFPKTFVWALRLLGALPAAWQLALGKRLSRASKGSE